MRLTTVLLCVAVAIMPAVVNAGAQPRTDSRATGAAHKYQHPDYRRDSAAGRSGQQMPQGYLLAATGKRWEDLSPREQEEIRQRKQRYESLPPQEKERIRQARERYEKMPPERKEQIRERWEKMPPSEKERYRLERKSR